jgi:hypothetical protein
LPSVFNPDWASAKPAIDNAAARESAVRIVFSLLSCRDPCRADIQDEESGFKLITVLKPLTRSISGEVPVFSLFDF